MNIIDKLKKSELAQPFGLLTKENQAILEKAKKKNCLCLTGKFTNGIELIEWTKPGPDDTPFVGQYTYILNRDYQPEPEYVDLEITVKDNWLGIWDTAEYQLPHNFTHLYRLLSLPEFAGFWSDESRQCEDDIAFQYISREIDKGNKVYARFRKEK